MADYTKATNFTAKDGLPTGNAGKIVKGTEIDTELTAVSNAIASKADINSPSFTGVPVGPTASAGTNTTQVATTAFVIAERTNTSTLTNKTLTSPAINTPAIVGGSITGITDLAVADGGTGSSTLAANNVLLGNGTSALQTVAPSSSGNILMSNGTTWTSVNPGFYDGVKVQAFTSSGTFTVPTGITSVKVSIAGGGGGGGGLNNGGNGGTSSFGSFVIGGGGGGGGRGFDNGTECTVAADGTTAASTNIPYNYFNLNLTRSPDYGSGGGGGTGSNNCTGSGGLNAGRGVGYVTGLTPGANITVTVGVGGTSGGGTGTNAGAPGIVVVEW